MIKLHASIHSVRVDREGETTIALKVPQSELRHASQLMELTEQVLVVTIASAQG